MKENLLSTSFTAGGTLATGFILCMGCYIFLEYLDIATSNKLATKDEKPWDNQSCSQLHFPNPVHEGMIPFP
eukprot:12889374-Prorocentrum_lima.AAC.1